MRGLRVGALAACAIMIAFALSLGLWSHGSADDQLSLGIIASGKMSERSGDECVIAGDHSGPVGPTVPHQVIIENAEGTIIAKRELTGLPLEGVTPTSTVESCTVHLSIDVPKSAFYRVYADDQFVMVVDATDLPFDMGSGDLNTKIPWIDFGE